MKKNLKENLYLVLMIKGKNCFAALEWNVGRTPRFAEGFRMLLIFTWKSIFILPFDKSMPIITFHI